MMIGMARVGKGQGIKPFMAAREIMRGKRRGQYQLTLTAGRRKNGDPRPGKKVFVDVKQICKDSLSTLKENK